MTNLKIYIKIISFATVVALIYTHLQVEIVELAYKGKTKEKRVHELTDTNGVLKHQILTLKSVNHLGNQLLEKNSNMQFMGNDRVMTLKAPLVAIRRPVQLLKPKQENPFWNILSLIGIGEAKAWE